MRKVSKSTVSVAVVALLVGLAFGIAAFPRTATLTTTQVVTSTAAHSIIQNETVISSRTESYSVVTFTLVDVLLVYYQGTCTTISGTPMVTYDSGPGMQLTADMITYNTSLPQQFLGVVYVTTQSASETTWPFTGAC